LALWKTILKLIYLKCLNSKKIKKEAEKDLFDDLDFNLDGALDEPKHEKKEFELDYLININKSRISFRRFKR
jgi:hypothetical protein